MKQRGGITLFCPYCHNQIPENRIFCPECGERLPQQKGRRRGRDRDSRVRRLIVAGIVLAVVLVATGGSLPVLLRPQRNPAPTAMPAATQTPSEKLGIRTAQPVQATAVPAVPTAVPTAKPTAKPAGTPDPRPANLPRQLNTVDEASALLEWMVSTYTTRVNLDKNNLSEEQMKTAVDRHPGIASWVDNGITLSLTLDPGVGIAAAVRNGKEDQLKPEYAAIAQRAKQIVSSIITPGMTDLQKEIAVHDYIIYHCDYEINESLHTEDARGFFNHGRVQCAGYSDVFQLLGSLCGLEIRAVSGDIVGETGGHEWNLIRLNGLWYGVDCTWDDPVGGGDENYTYLNFPHHLLDGDHIYDHAALPQGAYARDFDANYYPILQGLAVRTIAEAEQQVRRQYPASGVAKMYSLSGKMDLNPMLGRYFTEIGGVSQYFTSEGESSIGVSRYSIRAE